MSAHDGSLIIGQSRAIQALRSAIADVAPTSLSVLIVGPTGAGKEVVAREIHRVGECRGTFVALNVCAVQEAMFEATLFGHVKGAFTGAVADAGGLLAEAHEGSLLLDEIGSLTRGAQLKLLRVMETKVYRPVGGRQDRRSAFRPLAATNENLRTLVAAGEFREDLLERLSGFVIVVPSLAEHRDDIPLLVEAFLRRDGIGLQARGAPAPRLTDSAIALLVERAWPRNVRELYNVLGRACAIAKAPHITQEHVVAACRHVHDLDVDDGAAGWSVARLSESDQQTRAWLVALLDRYRGDTKAVAQECRVDRVTVYRWMKRLHVPTAGRQTLRGLSEDAARPTCDRGG